METHIHMMQVVMLLTSLLYHWRGRSDFFASGNLSIYYPVQSPRTGAPVRRKLAFRGPDFFVVRGAKPKPTRNSWVVENEDGLYPSFIFEVLSKSTRSIDRGKKKKIYEQIFRTPEYFMFDPRTCKLEGYRLSRGRYVPIAPDASGRLPSEELGLSVALHESDYLGQKVARFFAPDGTIVPVFEEATASLEAVVEREAARAKRDAARAKDAEAKAARAERDKAQAERDKVQAERDKAQAEAKAAQAERQNELLLAKLRELGVDPGEVRQGRPARANRRPKR